MTDIQGRLDRIERFAVGQWWRYQRTGKIAQIHEIRERDFPIPSLIVRYAGSDLGQRVLQQGFADRWEPLGGHHWHVVMVQHPGLAPFTASAWPTRAEAEADMAKLDFGDAQEQRWLAEFDGKAWHNYDRPGD